MLWKSFIMFHKEPPHSGFYLSGTCFIISQWLLIAVHHHIQKLFQCLRMNFPGSGNLSSSDGFLGLEFLLAEAWCTLCRKKAVLCVYA